MAALDALRGRPHDIIVAHRLSTIRHCELVARMDEDGSSSSVRATNPGPREGSPGCHPSVSVVPGDFAGRLYPPRNRA